MVEGHSGRILHKMCSFSRPLAQLRVPPLPRHQLFRLCVFRFPRQPDESPEPTRQIALPELRSRERAKSRSRACPPFFDSQSTNRSCLFILNIKIYKHILNGRWETSRVETRRHNSDRDRHSRSSSCISCTISMPMARGSTLSRCVSIRR